MSLCVLDHSSDTYSHSVYRASRSGDVGVRTFEVRTNREANGVWAAFSRDIPGMNLEADSLVDLYAEIREWGPELLLDNHVIAEGERFAIVVHSSGTPYQFYS